MTEPDRTEPIYEEGTTRVIERAKRGDLDPEIVQGLDANPHHYLEANALGTVYYFAPDAMERHEIEYEIDPINRPA
jgi:hypothetical protein